MDETKKALLSIDIDTAALSQNVANAKAAVADLSNQLKELKTNGQENTDTFAKVSEQLKKAGEEASKSKEAYKEYATNLKDTANASDKLKESTAKLSSQHGSATGETEKYSKTLKEYGKDLTNAAEKANPVIGSIGETAKAFKAFKEIAGQVGDGLKNYKNNISTAHESSKTFNGGASDSAKAFEALKTGSDIAAGGVSGFSKALASTGIGLVIVAVAALMDYLKQFTPLVDAVEQVTAGLSGGFNALGRIVLDLISPLKKLFTDPKQAMVDLVQFLEQNIINRFKALGVIINGIIHLDFKKVTDGVIQLGTGVTNATDKIANYSKVIVKAGIDTAKLKGEQQELARNAEGEALKASEAEAKIAELRVKAQTTNLVKRKQYLKEIADLESGQAKLHADNINKGVDLAIKDVAIKRALTQQEIALIKSKGTAELDLLQKNGRIYADDVKGLGAALGKKFELQKSYAEKRQAVHTKTSTAIRNDKKEAATADIKQNQDANNQELRNQKELFDLKQEAAIKAERTG